MAKGIVVAAPGEITQGISSGLVDDIFLNRDLSLFQRAEAICRGPLVFPALTRFQNGLVGKTLATVICYRNTNFQVFFPQLI